MKLMEQGRAALGSSALLLAWDVVAVVSAAAVDAVVLVAWQLGRLMGQGGVCLDGGVQLPAGWILEACRT